MLLRKNAADASEQTKGVKEQAFKCFNTEKVKAVFMYTGSRLLSTTTKTGSTETTEYHHPDRLGTKLVTTAKGSIKVSFSFG